MISRNRRWLKAKSLRMRKTAPRLSRLFSYTTQWSKHARVRKLSWNRSRNCTTTSLSNSTTTFPLLSTTFKSFSIVSLNTTLSKSQRQGLNSRWCSASWRSTTRAPAPPATQPRLYLSLLRTSSLSISISLSPMETAVLTSSTGRITQQPQLLTW